MRRRTFLKYLFGGSFVAYLDAKFDALAAVLSTGSIRKQGIDAGSLAGQAKYIPSHIAEILRTDDLLNLRIEFLNLAFNPAKARLERIDTGSEAYVRVHFPPQHVAEQAFDINDPSVPAPPIKSHIAGDSRLVFALPKGVNEIPYELAALLSWEQWKPSLVPVALPPEFLPDARTAQKAVMATQRGHLHSSVGGYSLRLPHFAGNGTTPAGIMTAKEYNASAYLSKADMRRKLTLPQAGPEIAEPEPVHTAIEAPTRLILSPHDRNGWAHSVPPVSRNSSEQTEEQDGKIVRTELWHTRLGVLDASGKDGKTVVDEQDAFLRTVRAVWSPDYSKNAGGTCGSGIRSESLTAGERNQIVHLTSDLGLDFEKPVQAKRLMLSALGSWLDLQGDWEPQVPFGLESWTHRATMGRDQFVRVICKGYLFPFGHRASLITITERRIEEKPVHGAYLRFRQFVIVREPEKQYAKEPSGNGRDAREGRSIPFQTVRLKTLVTPNLNPVPAKADGWLQVDKQDFLFKIEAEDWDGRRCEFTAALNFMENTLAEESGGIGSIIQRAAVKARADLYNEKPEYRARRERPLAGQKIAYAPSSDPGDTSFETDLLVLGGGFRKDANKGELLFYPLLQSAKVRLAAASRLTGANTGVAFSLFDAFVENGFGAGNDEGQVFAKVPDALALNFPTDRAGGVATPNMAIRGLSRRFGIVGGAAEAAAKWEDDLAGLAKGQLPDQFFQRFFSGAKLLGAVSLADIIGPHFNGGRNVPRFQSTPVYDAAGDLSAIRTRFEWQPSVQDSGVFVASRDSATATLRIVTETVMPLDGSPASSVTTGELANFTLDLLGGISEDLRFIKLKFGSFSFTARDRQKTDFSAGGVKIEFAGALRFLRTLEEQVHADDFSDPPTLDVSSDGVRLGYTLRLPSVTAGLFALENISFSAGLLLPFTGAPLDLRLAFSERDNPFTLTYAVFAGGGFFGIGLGTDGLHAMEAALEFGGNLSLSLGVASGKAYLMVGIYFQIEQKGSDMVPQLTGYVRSGAALEVLGLITVSVQFRLDLTYEPSSGNATGSGTVTVEVDVAFFSKSVDITLSKSFKGEGGTSTAGLFDDGAAAGMLAWLGGESEADAGRCWDEYCAAFAGGAA